jgi:hypothetical protein
MILKEINISFKDELNRFILSRKSNDPFYVRYCKIIEHLNKETGELHSPEQMCPLL